MIMSPLGEYATKLLNNEEEIVKSCAYMVNKVSLIQINVDIQSNGVRFKKSHFKDSNVKFGWPGYNSGNKMGYKITAIKV